jgi:hypothetical protein
MESALMREVIYFLEIGHIRYVGLKIVNLLY